MPTKRRPQRSRVRRRFDHGEPIRWLNLVPLAGVLAIAAALILSAYGIRPHALMVDLPMPYPDGETGPLTPNVNRLVVRDDGKVLWNAQPVSDKELGLILDQLHKISPAPGLLFTPEARAPYARVIEVLGMVRAHGALDRCFRFSGIARYRHYERPETFDDLLPATREDCPPPPPQL
ncbi:MAG: hypothetical protein R3E14_07605 [Erythrobacter sp.]